MFCIETYMKDLTEALRQQFGARLCYVGLQGSYLRGEATAESDIDVMTVIDGMTLGDLDAYREKVRGVGEFQRACGFICGKQELANWNPMELCHVLHTTKDYYGVLAELIPAYTEEDVRNFVKMSVNNLFHEICHRYIYASPEKNAARLPGSYKGVFFILQNLCYLESGEFIATKRELLPKLRGADRDILETAMALGRGVEFPADTLMNKLYDWCRETMAAL